MASAIDIVNTAFIQLGEDGISSFTEDSVSAEIASALYTSVKNTTIAMHPWKFATRFSQLSRLADAVPGNPYDYAFQLPSDYVRTLNVDYLSIPFDIVGDKLFSNNQTVTLEYVYNVEETHFPAWFTKLVEYRVAAEAAIPIAQSVNRAEYFSQLAERHLRECRRIDAQQAPTEGFRSFAFLRGN